MRSRTTFEIAATGFVVVAAALLGQTFASDLQARSQPVLPPVLVQTRPAPPEDPTADPSPRTSERWECAPRKSGAPVVQVAILLDTSNSMDGLIHQARTQLWRIVNELGRATCRGHRPQIQVALYEYGKSSLSREQGYVRQLAPFTTDLDRLSESLFALRTRGGDEYCGWVIRDAVRDLDWAQRAPGNLRMILIAGNEPFSQGPIDYRTSCREATDRGVLINSIFCGDAQEGSETGWAEGAALGGGSYLTIAQDQRAVYRPAPQDDEIRKLNVQLNQTYIPYSRKGNEKLMAQSRQDSMVASEASGGSAEAGIQRAVAKANGAVYNNASWDLVDARREGRKVADIKEEELPESLRAMPAAEREKYVDAKLQEREQVQKRIAELNRQREQHLAAHPSEADRSLAASVLQVVHAQGERAGYHFER